MALQERHFGSATKSLNRYIRLYEQEQTMKLACTMTELSCQTPKSKCETKSEPSTLGREIKLAQTLLERSHCEFHDDSLRCGAVDDLLIEPHANFQKTAKNRTSSNIQASDSFEPSSLQSCISPLHRIASERRQRHRRRARKTLHFSSDFAESSDDNSASQVNGIAQNRKKRTIHFKKLLKQSHSSGDSNRLRSSSRGSADLEDFSAQVSDLERTKRLVNDLKADLLSGNSSAQGVPFPDRESMTKLIEHLSAVAGVREESLRRSTSCRSPELRSESSEETALEAPDKSTCDSSSDEKSFDLYSLNGVSYTPHHRKYEHLHHRLLSSQVTTESSSVTSVERSGSGNKKLVKQPSSCVEDEDDVSVKDNESCTSERISDSASTLLTNSGMSATIRLVDQRTCRSENSAASDTEAQSLSTLTYLPSEQCQERTPLASSTSSSATSPSLSKKKAVDCRSTWENITNRRSDRRQSDVSSHISVSFQLEGKPTAIKTFMEDCLSSSTSEATSNGPGTATGGQTGSVEALKNMIFTLQGLAQPGLCDVAETPSTSEGERSLLRAMEHLSNLTSIVQR